MKNLDFFKFHSNLTGFRLNNDMWYFFSPVLDSSSLFYFYVYSSNNIPLFQGFLLVSPFFIRCSEVSYSDYRFMRFRPDELSRFEPRILKKYRNVSNFIPSFTSCLVRIYNEFFYSRISEFYPSEFDSFNRVIYNINTLGSHVR